MAEHIQSQAQRAKGLYSALKYWTLQSSKNRNFVIFYFFSFKSSFASELIY